LILNQSRIRIAFPAGTRFELTPDQIRPQFIQVNDRPVSVKLMLFENVLTFIVPANIDNEAQVTVFISHEVGLVNPSKTGAYNLQVSTSEDTEWVSSDPYTIESSQPNLTVKPEYISRPAEYLLSFLLESYESLSSADPIEINFPPTVSVPASISKNHVSINDIQVNKIDVKAHQVLVYPAFEIASGSMTHLRFHIEANIQNPEESQDIRLSFRLEGSPALRWSSTVNIKEMTLQWIDLNVNPPNAGAKANYDFMFQLGSKGNLTKSSEIHIYFPQGTTFEALSKNYHEISVNDVTTTEYHWKIPGILTIKIPLALKEETNAHIHIPSETGICNPKEENQWVNYGVSTEAEQATVFSSRLYISPALPETKMIVSSGKVGLNGWYVEPPLLSFICTQEEVITRIWWDDHDDAALEYSDPFRLDPGYYIRTLCFFSESAYGKEPVQKKAFKIDTLNPSFSILDPSSPHHLTNNVFFTIYGKVHPSMLEAGKQQIQMIDNPLLINNEEIELNQEGEFWKDAKLTEGENQFLIQCFDEAGNQTQKTIILILDTMPPQLHINSPKENDTVMNNQIMISGVTDFDAQILIEGLIVYVSTDGSFEHLYPLTQSGKHELLISASDPAGNSTDLHLSFWAGITVKLQIGASIVKINHETKNIDVAPFIKNNRAMVPVRVLADALNATLSYASDEKTGLVTKVVYKLDQIILELYINQNYALLNGKKVLLDVPAVIYRQRTMIPLRFVAENLRSSVYWDPSDESIMVVYWNFP